MEVASACISEWNIYVELNQWSLSVFRIGIFKVKTSSTGRAFEPGHYWLKTVVCRDITKFGRNNYYNISKIATLLGKHYL